ncbi:MAG TPA: Rieske (2Fe-2S) protein [Candidatus Dormibacteraeota bacterium]|nr:Rieske (2Fe-2S) protein [Candidatus Dormibacteraeota bacterium]
MHRLIDRLVEAQASWAKPIGERVQGWLAALFDRTRPLKDVLNGVWLGHPVHPVVTDVPVGALTAAALLDLAGQERAADIAVATGIAGMAASAATGAADAVDTYGRTQVTATVHATLMVATLGLYTASLGLRVARPRARPLAIGLSYLGYVGLLAGAYLGGDLVFRLGNMVDRHAWRSGGAKWKPLDVAEVPEGTLVGANLGKERLVLLREGDRISALHGVCAHEGGPLDKGTLVDGCVQCPWHGSRFRLADGSVARGPAVYDQPVYEVRATESGFEARLRPADPE